MLQTTMDSNTKLVSTHVQSACYILTSLLMSRKGWSQIATYGKTRTHAPVNCLAHAPVFLTALVSQCQILHFIYNISSFPLKVS